jgi:hypothetical protein
MADIAVAIAKLQTEMRKQNREQTMVETEAVVKEMNTQADEIKSKAIKQFVGGLVSGILTTAAGVVTLGGSVSALNGLTKNLAAGNMTVQEALARMENTSTFWSSIAKIGEGVGNIWNTGWNYGAGLNEADIKRSEARQQWHQSAIDNLKSYSDSCKEVADRALNTAETILQSSNQLRQRVLG